MRKFIIILFFAGLLVLFSGCGNSGLQEVMSLTGMNEEEIVSLYDKAERAYSKDDYGTALKLYSSIIGYKDSEQKSVSAQDKYVAEALIHIQEFQDAGQFVEALNYIDVAEQVVGENAELRDKTDEILSEYKKSVFSLADQYSMENKYDVAISVLNSIKSQIGSDAQVDAKIIEIQRLEVSYHKSGILNDIENFENTKDKSSKAYGDLIGLIESRMDAVGNDSEIIGLLADYKNAYCDAILKEAAIAFEGSGYETALTIVSAGLKVVTDDIELQNAYEVYNSYKPTPLCELDIFVDNRGNDGWYYEVDEATDNLGDTHTDIRAGYGDIVYLVDGYSNLSGVFFQRSEHKSESGNQGESTLSIYGDDVLLYDATMKPGMEPDYFDVDISGIQKLRIVFSMDRHAAVKGFSKCYAAIGDLIIQK